MQYADQVNWPPRLGLVGCQLSWTHVYVTVKTLLTHEVFEWRGSRDSALSWYDSGRSTRWNREPGSKNEHVKTLKVLYCHRLEKTKSAASIGVSANLPIHSQFISSPDSSMSVHKGK